MAGVEAVARSCTNRLLGDRGARANRMNGPASVCLTVELELGRETIKGWVQEAGAARREFEGMLELLALLEEIRQRAGRGWRATNRDSPERPSP